MKVVAAYLLAILGGNASLSSKDLKTILASRVEVPESVMNLTSKRGSLARKARTNAESIVRDQAGMARERFQITAKPGCDLGQKWLERLDEEENHLLTED